MRVVVSGKDSEMRWKLGRRSSNVEDRRSARGRVRIPAGRTGSIGIGGMIIVVLAAWFLGIDPSAILQGIPDQTTTSERTTSQRPSSPADDELKEFVATILGYTEDTWSQIFSRMDRTYKAPTLVLFTDRVSSACGLGQAAMGPFYCPGDQKVYIDLGFFSEMKRRLGAPGDFAQAYVVAHEVGHHVQTLLGIAGEVNAARRQASQTRSNQLSVRMELQADCFSGLWARQANETVRQSTGKPLLESGDIEEGLNAANAIGDDRLQRQSQGYVVPDSFTHGSSAQRVRWFRRGFETGDMRQCDTFGATEL